MNGTFNSILLGLIGGLLGLVQILFGFLLKAHKDSDKASHDVNADSIKRLETRIEQVAKRVHDLTAIVGKTDQWQRFHDKE
jgi:hypothetical protein